MTIDLKRYTEAYATLTVAAYEPLLLNWISLIGIRFISDLVVYRMPKAAVGVFKGESPTSLALIKTFTQPVPPTRKKRNDNRDMPLATDINGQAIRPVEIKKINVPGYPNAVSIGNDVYLNGILAANPEPMFATTGLPVIGNSTLEQERSSTTSRLGSVTRMLKNIPLIISNRIGRQQSNFDFINSRDTVEKNLIKAAKDWAQNPDEKDLSGLMVAGTKVDGQLLPHLWPVAGSIHEALSPIGIVHYYRQLYFNKEEGVGPIEEAFTIAPLETLEIVYQTIRRQIHEEILEQGSEVISASAVEEKNLDEVSDKVSSMMQQDVSASMSANMSGGIAIWQVGASASTSFSVSSQRSREYSSRRLKEVTKQASERITKSFAIKTRDTTEVTDVSTTHRVIRNENADPVSYGLRRVMRRVNVKIQDLGPKLVWQLYLRNPGEGLSRSRFVHFRESAPISLPEIPPGVAPRPSSGVDSGSITTRLQWQSLSQSTGVYYVSVDINPGSDRDVTGVRIDNISNLEGGGKDDEAPVPLSEYDLGSTWDSVYRKYTAKIAVKANDSLRVKVTYTYTWEPSQDVMTAWENARTTAWSAITEEALIKQFEQNKKLITEKSRVKSRPVNDLRREERYEVMNRMVGYLFGRGDDHSEPTPIEIEYFHRYFDIDAIFTYTHPAWWKPRFMSRSMGIEREAYEITAESEPAPLGSSLGWIIQLDGDRRRNEFLNSPWARVCIPIRSGREREAIQWLARHLEGEVGFDLEQGTLAGLLSDIEKYRDRENKLGLSGADYVTVDSTPGAPVDLAKPEGVYPVIDQFDVTMPTDGFVYDILKVPTP